MKTVDANSRVTYIHTCMNTYTQAYMYAYPCIHTCNSKSIGMRGGGLGSRPKKMYGERLGDGVEYHLMKPTPHR